MFKPWNWSLLMHHMKLLELHRLEQAGVKSQLFVNPASPIFCSISIWCNWIDAFQHIRNSSNINHDEIQGICELKNTVRKLIIDSYIEWAVYTFIDKRIGPHTKLYLFKLPYLLLQVFWCMHLLFYARPHTINEQSPRTLRIENVEQKEISGAENKFLSWTLRPYFTSATKV